MKKSFLIAWLICLLMGICLMFWHNDYVYSLPTSIPAAYATVPVGRQIKLPFTFHNNKPVFLHFFNPDCPCSRFNVPHFKSLVNQYRGEVNFAMVLMTGDKSYTEKRIHEKYGIDIPVYRDSSIAVATGVYSTPQAVILTSNHTLYFRGNYNKSRYCTNKQTNYAQMSLDSLLHNRQRPILDLFAVRAYGCQLPQCSKN